MSQTLDVKTLCLGVLSHGPASGYDIKKYFEQTFSHFYLAGYGSIYPALAELAAAGLVAIEDRPHEGRPDRKVYALTEAGRERFLAALRETEPSHKVRSEFLVLMHFAHLLPPERIAAILDERVASFEHDLALLERIAAGDAAAEGGCADPRRFCVGYGLAVLTAARDYVASRRAELDAPRSTPRAAPKPAAVALASAGPRRKTGT
jgi:PadR family transcriptional regulator AphA